MDIDVKNLSYKELISLENKIKERKKNLKEFRVYEITFHVGFFANEHENDDLCATDSFGDWFVNASIYDDIANTFGLDSYSHISGCDVKELNQSEFPEMFKKLIK